MISVLVVDDSAIMRRLVSTAISLDPEITVVGTAVDGLDAVKKVDELLPDAITLDIEMPNCDGLEALRRIKAKHPRIPVVMVSTLTKAGAAKTLEALSLGASDYVTKPSNTGSYAQSMELMRTDLAGKIKALAGIRRLVRPKTIAPAPPAPTPPRRPNAALPPRAILIGCSTGGPDALAKILPDLPANLPVPVVIVQHMPAVFTAMLAERLDGLCPLRVREADDGPVHVGEVVIAPGGLHVRLESAADGTLRTTLSEDAPVNFCRPAVDVLFESAAQAIGGQALVVVLTGMGHDGQAGAETLRSHGAQVIVQDESTSVVWGMPGAIVHAGQADKVLPLPQIAGAINRVFAVAASR